VLPTVDPSTVPANAVTGPATLTRGSVRAAEVSVPLDKLVIVVHLQDVTGQGDWRVSDVEPV
jgi:hypothetical protein